MFFKMLHCLILLDCFLIKILDSDLNQIFRRTPVGWWWNGLTPLGWMIPSQLVLALQLRVSCSLKWASCFLVTPGSLASVNSQKQGLEKFEYLFPLSMDLLFCLRLSLFFFFRLLVWCFGFCLYILPKMEG